MLTLLTWQTKTNTYTKANSVDPEEMTHNELSHEDLQLSLCPNSEMGESMSETWGEGE